MVPQKNQSSCNKFFEQGLERSNLNFDYAFTDKFAIAYRDSSEHDFWSTARGFLLTSILPTFFQLPPLLLTSFHITVNCRYFHAARFRRHSTMVEASIAFDGSQLHWLSRSSMFGDLEVKVSDVLLYNGINHLTVQNYCLRYTAEPHTE